MGSLVLSSTWSFVFRSFLVRAGAAAQLDLADCCWSPYIEYIENIAVSEEARPCSTILEYREGGIEGKGTREAEFRLCVTAEFDDGMSNFNVVDDGASTRAGAAICTM